MRNALPFALLFGTLIQPMGVKAQIYGDYIAPTDDHSLVWFGFVKSRHGDYIEGATVVLAGDELDFVAVSDHLGRFRFELPERLAQQRFTARCSHPAFSASFIRTRPPRRGALSPYEINCLLEE